MHVLPEGFDQLAEVPLFFLVADLAEQGIGREASVAKALIDDWIVADHQERRNPGDLASQ